MLTTTERDSNQAQTETHRDRDLQMVPLSCIISSPNSSYTQKDFTHKTDKDLNPLAPFVK